LGTSQAGNSRPGGERIWKKCWQFACRESISTEIGDYIVYEIAECLSIVVRHRAGRDQAIPTRACTGA